MKRSSLIWIFVIAGLLFAGFSVVLIIGAAIMSDDGGFSSVGGDRIAVIPVEVRTPGDFDGAFAAMMRQRPDALLMTNDPLHQLHVGWIIDFQARNRLPGMFQARENVVAGGFLSYGASLPDLFRRAAGYVHRILQGTKPEDLPVEHPAKFELALNMKTAKALGLPIPESYLLRVDEVIE